MKEATGELTTTVVVIVAIIIIIGLIWALKTPAQEYIQNRWNAMTGQNGDTIDWNNDQQH